MKKVMLKLNKPAYVAMFILDVLLNEKCLKYLMNRN